MTIPAPAQKKSVSRRAITAALLLLAILLTLRPIPTAAQSEYPSYWQYAMSSRLESVLAADINGDGIDEFLLADENNHVDLVSASGQSLWSYVAADSVTALGTANVLREDVAQPVVAVGMAGNLILLSAAGDVIWQREFDLRDGQSSPESSFVAASPDSSTAAFVEIPVEIKAINSEEPGRQDILVLLQSGSLLRFDMAGNLLWKQTDHRSEGSTSPPRMLVSDFDQDGEEEIVLAVFNPRRFGQLVLIDNGRVLWDLSLSRSVTDLQEIQFRENSRPLIAVSTTSGHVSVYDYLRRRHWLRTLNTPATSLAPVRLAGQSVLAVGTDTGAVTVFNEQGRRLWTTYLDEEAGRAVDSLTPAPALPLAEGEPILAATLRPSGDLAAAEIYLINGRGRVSSKIGGVDIRGPSQFIDSNHDNNNELLISRYATLELLGMGVGSSSNVQVWEYALNAAPGAALVADLSSDGNPEILVGTEDGRVQSLGADRTINWLFDAGGAITNLAVIYHPDGNASSLLVAGRNDVLRGDSSSWIQLREANGERVWERDIRERLTSLAVQDIVLGGDPEVLAGTEDGRLLVFSSLGEVLWETAALPAGEPLRFLSHAASAAIPAGEIIAAGGQQLVSLNILNQDLPPKVLANFDAEISGLYPTDVEGDSAAAATLVAVTLDGRVHGFDHAGKELVGSGWPIQIATRPTAGRDLAAQRQPPGRQTGASPLLLGTDAGELLRLDLSKGTPVLTWQFQGLGSISDVAWYDHNADGSPDIAAAGNRQGRVFLYENADGEAPLPSSAPLELAGAIFSLEALARESSAVPDLLVIAENGLVQLFRDQENRPPLLTNPVAVLDRGQYSITATLNDVEGDEVVVSLELFDPVSRSWTSQGSQLIGEGAGALFWALPTPPESPQGLRYRFVFSDGSYTSTTAPFVGPPPVISSPWATNGYVLAVGAGVAGLILAVAYYQQAQTPGARAKRFYQQIQESPSQTLTRLEEQIRSGNSLDLMPHLASRARKVDDKLVTGLADGLFLLPEQPMSGLPILNQSLVQLSNGSGLGYRGKLRWQSMLRTSQNLLDAPTIAELSLHLPQLEQLVDELDVESPDSNAFRVLAPILTSIRDSERVDLAEDRLVYLNIASMSLEKAGEELVAYAPSVEFLLVNAICGRWSGLVSAEIADLKGRAELVVTLKTRRLVPDDDTEVAMEVLNNGRSVAENILAVLDETAAYVVHNGRQEIAHLPPGRTRELRFKITPQVPDRFRVALTLTFSDHSEHNRRLAFGDMVHILPPVRDFSTVANPYTPGTPLRQNSLLFFGRESLFEFIAENTGQRSYRNVLILVGQRRTGKTSVLLRLEDHLPPQLLPVYVDCQSLGVVPGMPALLEELAWYISDALSRRGIEVTVPDLDEWEKDPTRLFQREFLPQVISLLPEDGTLLLVFDEFEAFEALVSDHILPPTFFTYLRHLMQHSERLNFIFVGTRRLEEMTTDYWSVLFNIALYRKIGFLDDHAARRLITEPVAPNLIYDDLALDKMLRVSAGHPYFLQLMCYTLVKHANKTENGYITISSLNAALDEMLSLGEVHFAYLWQRSTLTERAILAAVSHFMDYTLPFHSEEVIQKLKPYSIKLDPAEITAAFNRLVERDIMREVTEGAKSFYEVRLGLVCLWITRNKSISKLFADEGSRAKNGHTAPEMPGKQITTA